MESMSKKFEDLSERLRLVEDSSRQRLLKRKKEIRPPLNPDDLLRKNAELYALAARARALRDASPNPTA